MVYEGFEPFICGNSKLLVLGSFPSVKSRSEGFYYGNRQNRFWRTLAEFRGCAVPEEIEQKKQLLQECRIALWDVVIQCEISGSMDKDIKNPVIARVDELIEREKIANIVANGKTAYELLIKNFPSLKSITSAMPSTSPANARFDKYVWLNCLHRFLDE